MREAQKSWIKNQDMVVESVIQDLRARSKKGIEEYGVTLEREDYDLLAWLKEAYTEALDSANYLKAAITKIEKDLTINSKK